MKKIGCQGMDINEWTDKYIDKLGDTENFSEKEVRLYKAMINLIKEQK